MKKSDLKNGQIVELRNGWKFYYFTDCFINDEKHFAVEDFNDDMLMGNCDLPEYDIMKVYRMNKFGEFPTWMVEINNKDLEVLWERKEHEEIEIEIDGNKIVLNETNINKLKKALKL